MSDRTRHEIIMPALGMTQDTGEIVSWHKAAGDAVQADDILFEVETDKTTMEVEAGFSGIVVDVRAAAGDTVPVGTVIAVIDTNAEAVAVAVEELVSSKATQTDEARSSEGANSDTDMTDAAGTSAPFVHATDLDQISPSSSPPTNLQSGTVSARPEGRPLSKTPAGRTTQSESHHSLAGSARILASPKAKLAAWEKGIALEQLVRSGVTQPLQYGDVEHFSPLTSRVVAAQSLLQARVRHQAYNEFLVWAGQQSENSDVSGRAWSFFATSAWRNQCAVDLADNVTVYVQKWSDRELDLLTTNADRMGLLAVVAADTTNDVQLVVRDMTNTVFVNYQSADEGTCPSLTVVDDSGDYLLLSLRFDESELSLDLAMALLNRISQLVEQPLRHLL